jgi:hypothetical protein
MSDVTWAHWDITSAMSPEQRSSTRHRSLLNILLKDPLPGSSGASDRDGAMPSRSVGISFDPQVEELKKTMDSLRDPISSDPLLVQPWDWYQDKEKYFADERRNTQKDAVAPGIFRDHPAMNKTIDFIIEGLEQCELTANRAELRKAHELLAAQMNLFACRVYLNTERAAGLIHGPLSRDLAAPGHVVIDLRFREHLGRYWLYAIFTASTHEPRIGWDLSAPSGSGKDSTDDSSLENSLEALRDRYAKNLRRGFQDHLHVFFPAAQMTILDRKYQPPRFWVAMGRDSTPTSIASPNGRMIERHKLLDTLLQVPGPDTIGLGVGDINYNDIDGRARARVFRRFMPGARAVHDRPVYLVLPSASSAVGEDNLRKMIQELSALEADAATRLFDIITDIDIYRSQLNLYEKIGSQGLALWDQVALFLPKEKGAHLSKAHRLIELIHQILLQGIADLEEEAANAEHTIERVKAVEHDLIDQFDRKFTERPVPGHSSIRDSLIKAGYFDKAHRAAQSLFEKSRQVRSTYTALLESMTYAFDERRARETDVLQWVALFFAIVLGILSIWNELLARYINGWQNVGPWVGSGAALIIFALVVVLVMRSRRSRLISRAFKKHFTELQKLLAAYSSDRLDRELEVDKKHALNALISDESTGDEAASTKAAEIKVNKWRKIDRDLATKTAWLLDNLPVPPTEPGRMESIPGVKLKELRKRVEAWALRALFVTERPRRFCNSALPHLTFLYRFFPMASKNLSQDSDWSAAAKDQVSDYDFRLTVVNYCGCEVENIPTLMRWGRRKVRESGVGCEKFSRTLTCLSRWKSSNKVEGPASRFVKKLQEIRLDGHLTKEGFYAMMDNINRSSWASNEFNGRHAEACEELDAARSLEPGRHAQIVCKLAENSAQLGLTGYLRGVGTGVRKDWDLIRLGVEFCAATGKLEPPVQDAIWRLSAYQDRDDQSSVHSAERPYGESEVKKALVAIADAEKVLQCVEERNPDAPKLNGRRPASGLQE